MDPFHIIISYQGKQLALNIHPKDKNGFMILFEGALVGEIFLNEQGNTWGAISARELLAGDYPAYPCDESVHCDGIMFDKKVIDVIGQEIAKTIG